MERKSLIWFQFLLIIFISSCSSDTKFELPKVNPVLAILSSNDLDNLFQVRVTIARPVEGESFSVNSDCKVILFENGNLFTELKQDTSDNSKSNNDQFNPDQERVFVKNPNVKFTCGEKYGIEVNVSGFPTLTAADFIPNPVKIKSIVRSEYYGTMPQWYGTFTVELLAGFSYTQIIPPLIEWTITFDDPPQIKNYYRIGVGYNILSHTDDSISYYIDSKVQYSSSTSNDPVFMYALNRTSHQKVNPLDLYNTSITKEIIFSDYNFDGKEYSVKILTPRPSNLRKISDVRDSFKYIISLYSLSEDYYKYWLDRYKVEKLYEDPFSEPVRVHSNISNGAGIFAFSSFDSDSISVDIKY